ncbi:hypothetical protein JTB14_028533 [Gonioctena quinquepunctata]|nr:hypothetical protein JTB14_028533 [Gonioctena quinquepunctata]
MGGVVETIPGRDGEIRVVRLKTASGELLRLVQRLLMLEMVSSQDLPDNVVTKETKECIRKNYEITEQEVQKRYGRRVKLSSTYKD